MKNIFIIVHATLIFTSYTTNGIGKKIKYVKRKETVETSVQTVE